MANIIIRASHIDTLAADEIESFNKPALRIWHNEFGKLVLARKNIGADFEGVTLVVDSDKYFEPMGAGAIYWSVYGEFMYVNDLHENRDKDAFLRCSYGCNEGAIAYVAWGETPDKCVVMSFIPTYCAETVSYGESTLKGFGLGNKLADEFIPGFFSARSKYVKARIAALRDIVPLDSTSDLEKQVDLLSMLVFSLVDAMPAEQRPSWYQAFADAVVNNSSTAFKTTAENIANVAETKAKIRQIQTDYFINKNG